MKFLISVFVSFFIFSFSAFSQGINLHSNQVTLPDLITLYYKDFEKRNIIVDDSVDMLTKLFRFDVSNLNRQQLSSLLKRVLLENNVSSIDYGDVLYFVVSEDSIVADAPIESDAIAGLIEGVDSVRKNLIDDYSTVKTFVPEYLDIDYVTSVVNSMTGMTYSHNGYSVPIFGTAELVDKVFDFLTLMDVPTPQIKIDALLVEYTSTDVDRSGFTFALQALSDKLSVSFGSISDFTNVFSFKGSDFSVIASLIGEDSRFKIISNPSVLVKSGFESKFHVGNSVPVLDSEFINNQTDSVRKSVIYRDSGFIFNVKPIAKKSLIDLTVSQQVSDFQLTKTSGIDSPTLNTRSFSSTFQLKPNQVLLVAGMDQWKETNSRSGIFFLPSFFDSVEKRTDLTQYVLLITASFVQ